MDEEYVYKEFRMTFQAGQRCVTFLEFVLKKKNKNNKNLTRSSSLGKNIPVICLFVFFCEMFLFFRKKKKKKKKEKDFTFYKGIIFTF